MSPMRMPLWVHFYQGEKQNLAQFKAYCVGCLKTHRPATGSANNAMNVLYHFDHRFDHLDSPLHSGKSAISGASIMFLKPKVSGTEYLLPELFPKPLGFRGTETVPE
jgi:hypothetical protein